MYLSKSKTTPQNIVTKNIFLLTEYTKHIRFCLPLPMSVIVYIFTVRAFIFLTFTPNTRILVTIIPQRIIITNPTQCIGPFTVTSGETCCHAIMIHSD